MDPIEVTSDGKYSQSMGNKEICILIVDDDHTCCAIVAKMIQSHTTYKVLRTGVAFEVLKAIEKRKDRFELVLTNVHRLESRGHEIIRCINEQFNLPTIYNMKIASKGQEHIVKANVVNSFNRDKINHLWQCAFEKLKAKKVETNNVRANSHEKSMSSQKRSIPFQETNSPSISQSLRVHEREEGRHTNEQTQCGKDEYSPNKKPRMVWTTELHAKFMKALDKLGEKAVPTNIVELMDHPGLTRENVASHLQKHRESRKRDKHDASSMLLGSILRLNPLQRNPFFAQQGYTISCQQVPSLLNPSQSQLFSANNQMDTPYLNVQEIPLLTVPQLNKYPGLGSLGFRNENSLKHSKQMCIPRQQDFKLFNQTKNIYTFAGLRLANNGKSIEFGPHKVFHSGTAENEFNVLKPASSMNQDMILNQYTSLMIDSNSQQPSQMTTFTSHIQLNTTPDQNPSALFDCISQELSLLENSPNDFQQQDTEPISRPTNENTVVQYSSQLPSPANKDDVQCISTPQNSILQQQPPMQFLENFKNESADQCPSALLFDPEMDWNEVWTPQLPQTPQQMNDFVNKGKMDNTLLQVNLDNLDFGQLFENDE
ncbi:unnamed protein product [Fraxinus pennsylvanica]|uniref:HTH myb-type domain-containing protein n=1 Tax=Fraxinus pennsylvanica TaxID=56036 RepID=A0AAD2E0F7_9LAMI|nr:unnamed protein product [Fraxinus pennsylvanica]